MELPDALVIEAVPPFKCPDGQPITLRARVNGLDLAAEGATYEWSTGETTPEVVVADTDIYGLLLKLGACEVTTFIAITESPNFPVTIAGADSTQYACPESPLVLSAAHADGLGDVAWAWSSGEATREITATAAGTYTVTVTDPYGCTHIREVVLDACPTIVYFEHTQAEVQAGEEAELCVLLANPGTEPTTVQVNITGDAGPYFDAATAQRTLTFAPGTTRQCLTYAPDRVDGADSLTVYTLLLANPTGGNAAAIGMPREAALAVKAGIRCQVVQDSSAVNCAIDSTSVPSDAPLITVLKADDSFWAGDFEVEVVKAQGRTIFNGKGRIVVPYLNQVAVNVDFSNITVNENCQMVSGEVKVMGVGLNILGEELSSILDQMLLHLDNIEQSISLIDSLLVQLGETFPPDDTNLTEEEQAMYNEATVQLDSAQHLLQLALASGNSQAYDEALLVYLQAQQAMENFINLYIANSDESVEGPHIRVGSRKYLDGETVYLKLNEPRVGSNEVKFSGYDGKLIMDDVSWESSNIDIREESKYSYVSTGALSSSGEQRTVTLVSSDITITVFVVVYKLESILFQLAGNGDDWQTLSASEVVRLTNLCSPSVISFGVQTSPPDIPDEVLSDLTWPSFGNQKGRAVNQELNLALTGIQAVEVKHLRPTVSLSGEVDYQFYGNTVSISPSANPNYGFDPNQINCYPGYEDAERGNGVPAISILASQTESVIYNMSNVGTENLLTLSTEETSCLQISPAVLTETTQVVSISLTGTCDQAAIYGHFEDSPCALGHLDVIPVTAQTKRLAVVLIEMKDEETGNYLPTPLGAVASSVTVDGIRQSLNDIYASAGVNWEVSLFTEQIDCDLNHDGMFDHAVSNTEKDYVVAQSAIRLGENDNEFDAKIYFAGPIASTTAYGAAMSYGSKIAFIYPITAVDENFLYKTIAHELGHAVYSLHHPFQQQFTEDGCYKIPDSNRPNWKFLDDNFTDHRNLMDYHGYGNTLRRYQWVEIENSKSEN